MSTTDRDEAIQQLWYTWSDIGIDPIRMGYRIRAASEGLRDLLSEHVKSLDRYQRYSLPPEAEADIPLQLAPVCLSFIIQGEDRILVHKQYTGRDAFGRYGIFFVHLLDNLPPDFSATDAISLWQSGLWQNSDASLRKKDPFGTTLETIPYAGWRKGIQERRKKQADQQVVGHALDAKDARRFEEHLSYLTWTYLIKKTCIDATNGRKEPEKIYIAAPDSYLALLISGLARCLPEPMVRDMTFSTYESDVDAAPTEIVGTCWLSIPHAEQTPQARQLLPSSYYTEKLALNCYTDERTPLNPFLLREEDRSITSAYIPHSMQYFLYRDSELEMFLDGMANATPTLEVLVKRYKTEILSAQNPSKEDVEFALANSDLKYVARMLSKKGYQQKIIELVLNKSGWWDTFARAHIIRLRTCSAEQDIPQLARALAQLASDAIPYATNAVKEGIVRYEAPQGIATHDRERFRIMKEVIQCAAPPREERDIWAAFFNDLRLIPDVSIFLNSYWECYAELMSIWAKLLPLPLSKKDYRLVQPLLSSLSWMRFGDFLALDLPLDWRERATVILLSQTKSILHSNIVASLQQQHSRIAAFMRQLSQERGSFTQAESQNPLPREAEPWKTVFWLFRLLADSSYGKKAELLSLLLDSPMGRVPEYAEALLKVARLITIPEIVSFLKANGPRSLPSSDKLSTTVFNMLSDLAKKDDAEARDGKMDVLRSWLEAPQLADWLTQPPGGEKHLAKILKAGRLNTEESEIFFLNYGKRYIAYYPSSPTLLKLFDEYGRTSGERRKEFLFYWLDIQTLSLATFEDALRAAHFSRDERIQFIEQHGAVYLPRYPQSQVLLDYVLEYLTYIQTASLSIFQMTRSPEIPSSAEGFLGFLWNWPQLDATPKPMINDYYQVAQLMRKPMLLNPAVIEATGRLLDKRGLAGENRNMLMKKLAIGCLEHEKIPLAPTMTMLSKVLPPQDIQSLLQYVAETAREGIRTHSYPSTLQVPVIRFALTSLKTILPEPAQEEGLQRFLGTLLEGTDERRLKSLDKEAQKWSKEEAAKWRRYRRLPAPGEKIPWWHWWEKSLPGLMPPPMPEQVANQDPPAPGETATAGQQGNPSIVGNAIAATTAQDKPAVVAGQPSKSPVVDQPAAGQQGGKQKGNRRPPDKPVVAGSRSVKPLLVIAMFMFALLLIVASATLGFLLVTGRVGPPATTVTPPTSTPQGQELFASSIQGTPVLTLNTTGHSQASVWNASGGFCSLRSAGYVALASLATQSLSLCLEHTQHFRDNFAYQARVSVDADGYGGGLVLFYTSGSQPYYRFALLNGGQYSVILVDPSSGPNLLKGPKPLPVRWQAGQPYLFTVIVQNQEVYFYIGTTDKNSTLVYQGAVNKTLNASTNADFLGIYASIYQNAETTITVSSLNVWNLPPGQKSPLPGNSPCHSELSGMAPPCSP